MRTRLFVMAAALLLVSAGAMAQDRPSDGNGQQDVAKTSAATIPDVGFTNQIDFGLRGTSFADNSDKARFQRYQDLRDGAYLDRFRFNKSTDAYLFKLQANHVGYLDQSFTSSYNRYGKVKATFEWNQTPLFYSESTQTLFTESSPGVLTLPDAAQTAVQNSTTKTATMSSLYNAASPFDLKSRRDVADFKLTYAASRNMDFNVTFKNTNRNGHQPFYAGFGFSDAVEMAAPVDTRTTEFGTALEFSGDHGFARLGYDGSFFRNNIGTLTWDNPLRVADSPTAGPTFGRLALWPNSDMNTVSFSGAYKLPARSQATAFISVGRMSQNDNLIPFTTNTALAVIPLERNSAEAEAQVTAMNYTFTSRPTTQLWFSARYRQYEFDNRTKIFEVGQTVNYDTAVATLNAENEPFGFTRHTFDADASFSPVSYLGFRAGYTREQVDRTFRFVEKTTEDVVKASVDATGVNWLTLRGVYEHSKRRGSPTDPAEMLSIGEQPSLRQYDIADRDRDRFNAILVLTPVSQFSINASAGIGKEDYPATDTRTVFGLRNNDNHVYSLGFDFVPMDSVSFGATYGIEKYTALQTSRTANPLTANTVANLNDPTQQFNDPRRDWSDDSADKVHTFNASMDLLKVFPKTDIKMAYDYSRAESRYVYSLPADQVVFTTTSLVQLPAITNQLQRGTIDGRYFVTKHLALGLVYWYDKYRVNDFALGQPSSLVQPAAAATPTTLFLGYAYRPYTANTFMGRFTYLW